MVTVTTKRCMFCGQGGEVVADEVGLARWQAGELIQVALPALSPSDREQLLTGTHSACWDAMFPPDEEE